MDKERKIRFLVAPSIFLFLLSLGFGFNENVAISDYLHGFEFDNQTSVESILILITGGGLALFSLGFIIGSLTYLSISGFWYCFKNSIHYEARPDDETMKRLISFLTKKSDLDLKDYFYLSVEFDFNYLKVNKKYLHEWLFRQWSAFSIASTSAMSVFLSLISFYFLKLFSCIWLFIFIFLFFVFTTHAFLAWKNTMEMLNFQTELLDREKLSANEKRPSDLSYGYLRRCKRYFPHH